MTHLPASALALLCFFAFGCAAKPPPPTRVHKEYQPPPAAPPVALDDIAIPAEVDADLTNEGRVAIQTIGKASVYGGFAVGYGGQPVKEVVAVQTLLKEKNAAAALTVVLDHGGTVPGQLLALTGLYVADHALFTQRAAAYRARTDTVKVRADGCLVYFEDVAVGEIVETKKPNAIRMNPGETFSEYVKRVKLPDGSSVSEDIAGGSYPWGLRTR